MTPTFGLGKALNSLLNNREALTEAILSATRAGWAGSGYSLELHPDGSYRVLWDEKIGNLYITPGVILSIPALTEDEWDGSDEGVETAYFNKAINELDRKFCQFLLT